MDVGRRSGDSMMATAAWEPVNGEAEDEPRTITWRLVDLRAEKRWEGGTEAWSAIFGEGISTNRPLPVTVTRFFSRSMSYRSTPENKSVSK